MSATTRAAAARARRQARQDQPNRPGKNFVPRSPLYPVQRLWA